MAMQEDDDLDGDVISMNGSETVAPADDAPANEPEDRGDVFDDEKPAAEDPAPKDETPPDPDAAGTKPQYIPKGRFDEVNSRKNELALENENLRLQLEAARTPKAAAAATLELETPPAPKFDERAREREYADALTSGDIDLALDIREEINTNIRREALGEFETSTNNRTQAQALNLASEQAVADFPYLDTDEGADALELILARRDAQMWLGVPAARALSESVRLIAPRFEPDSSKTPPDRLPTSQGAVDTRTRDALKRGAAASLDQPPTLQDGSGNRAIAGKVNVADLTEEQFEALSLAEKKRARGD